MPRTASAVPYRYGGIFLYRVLPGQGHRLAPGRGAGIYRHHLRSDPVHRVHSRFALMMIWIFAFKLGWLPVGKFLDPLIWRNAEVSANYVFNLMLITAAAFTVFAFLVLFAFRRAGRIRLGKLVAPVILVGSLAVPVVWAFSGIGGLALDILKHMVLPIATLTLISFAGTMLLTRNSMLETVREDYVMAARAKGLPEKLVRDRHAARNALLPVVTSLVYSLIFAIDGSVIIEGVFSWPGTGMTLLQAVRSEDLPLVMGAWFSSGCLPTGPHDSGCALRLPGPEDTLPVTTLPPNYSSVPPSVPGDSPEPPEIELGRGRFQLARARLRLTLRSFRNGWDIFLESRIGLLSLVTILIFALMAISHPILMATVWDADTYDPGYRYAFDRLEQPAPPSWRHPLGTDPLGRDVLSQLLSSTRSEFILGITAALVTVVIATTVGAVAAYYGGLVDAFFMRLADLIIALPGISLLIVLSALFKLNLFYLALIIGLLGRVRRHRHNPQVPGVEHQG